MVDVSQRIGSPGVTLTTLLMAAFACALGEWRETVGGVGCMGIHVSPSASCQNVTTSRLDGVNDGSVNRK